MLSTTHHPRDSAGLRYVYPVISRRAGGVSIGINLNVNQACNWACLYCQVENLSRGGPPPIDLARLTVELRDFLAAGLHSDYLTRHAPPEARRWVDVAFSGDGEPTAAPEFADAVQAVIAVLDEFALRGKLMLRLITNGSFLHRPAVRAGIAALGDWGGEVWFKFDRAGDAASRQVNGVPQSPARTAAHLIACAQRAPTWVQTCWFGLDGHAPDAAARSAYCDFLAPLAARLPGQLQGVHLYGLARPSRQPAAPRLSRLAPGLLDDFAEEIRSKTGLKVNVSP